MLDISNEIIEILEIIMKNTGYTQESVLSEIGVNSISFIKFVVEIEKKYKIEFEDEQLDYTKFLKISNLREYIESKMYALNEIDKNEKW